MNRFCSECGQKIESEQLFCPECGAPQQTIKKETTQPQPVNPPSARKPLSFKKKLSFTLIAVLMVGLVGGHQLIKANTSPEQKVDAFLQALYAGDTDAAMAEITIPDNVRKDEEAYQEFLVEQDPDGFKNRMYEAAHGVVDDGITRIVSHEDGLELFRIKEGKFIGMYPVIQIEAMPVDVQFATDVEGAQFELADTVTETRTGDTEELGAFLPGTYDCRVSMENGIVEKALDLECEISGSNEMVLEVSILDLMVEIWTNHENAIIYVNGESTEKTVKENNLLGLIGEGQTVDLFVERTNENGELETSEVITADSGSYVELPIYSADPNEEEDSSIADDEEKTSAAVNEDTLAAFIADFRAAYENALNQKDFSYVAGFLEEGSIARDELVDFIDEIGNDYYLYEFLVDEAVDIEILDEKAYVTTYEEFNFTNHLDAVTTYNRSKRYEIQLSSDGTPQISRIDIMDTVRD
ncbi:TcaA NTF2-like domain-containing protein [Metaplanococcus flavidus]|uniref:Zinc-ribbon domain-containing protein n=1 Tax=Metaplanococcus flavidus TaxID=569883 RepID=A0ABW3LB95_9BACL